MNMVFHICQHNQQNENLLLALMDMEIEETFVRFR